MERERPNGDAFCAILRDTSMTASPLTPRLAPAALVAAVLIACASRHATPPAAPSVGTSVSRDETTATPAADAGATREASAAVTSPEREPRTSRCRALDPQPPRCGATPSDRCVVRSHSVVSCDGDWPSSMVARADGVSEVATFVWSAARASTLLTLGDDGLTQASALPDGAGVPRIAASATGLHVLADVPSLQRVARTTSSSEERELLPADGRIIAGASEGADGTLDVLLARGGVTPATLHLAHRASDGAWTSQLVGESPWPYAALTRDGAGRPVVAYCATAGRTFDLVYSDAARASHRVLRGAGCGDRQLAVGATRDALVFAFRAGDLHVAAPGARGRYADLRVADTAPARLDACPQPATTPAPDTRAIRCTAHGSGTTAHALAAGPDGAWIAWIEARLEVDLSIQRQCHPVDPVGRRIPPPSCEDVRTPISDRSEATLVLRPIVMNGDRPSLGEAIRAPLGRVPDERTGLLLDLAGGELHAVVAHEGRERVTLHHVVVPLPRASR